MSDKTSKGREGEARAAAFLEAKGYTVLERNYRHKRSEIDLIVKKDAWIVFVEVKLRTSDSFGYPEEFVNRKKVMRILEGAEYYTYVNRWEGPVRYDIVSIRQLPNEAEEIRHIEDAFY
ncbi:MAG: YraN family protein [Cyclobacteriaceae bacterium]|jgi:putative endonuclease|nr:YraN family protein [Cyclobacteriaceae bacterium]